ATTQGLLKKADRKVGNDRDRAQLSCRRLHPVFNPVNSTMYKRACPERQVAFRDNSEGAEKRDKFHSCFRRSNRFIGSCPNQPGWIADKTGRSGFLTAHAGPKGIGFRNRVFKFDVVQCPHCGGTLKIIAAIEDPAVITKILSHSGLPTRAPPRTPAQYFDCFLPA
ncbi:MAG: hypothetical protein ACU836_18370, partial [Gammaproteobacteria bacterium]